MDFSLKKKCPAWWPRLTSQPQKPSWLKIDFDKWTSEDLDDNEDEKRDICSDYPGMYDKLHQEEFGYKKGNTSLKECFNTLNVGQHLYKCSLTFCIYYIQLQDMYNNIRKAHTTC